MNPTNVDVLTGQQRTNDNLIVMFFTDTVQNKRKTLEAGRPIFDEVPFIQINIPGDTSTEIVRPARESDKTEYAKQWESYISGKDRHIDGTPLSEWPLMSRSQVAELNALNIWSVENLANLSDEGLSKIGMGAREMQRNAKAFLEGKSGVDAKLQATQEQLQEALARIAELEKPKRKRRTKAEMEAARAAGE